jgi:hypothetical protein
VVPKTLAVASAELAKKFLLDSIWSFNFVMSVPLKNELRAKPLGLNQNILKIFGFKDLPSGLPSLRLGLCTFGTTFKTDND